MAPPPPRVMIRRRRGARCAARRIEIETMEVTDGSSRNIAGADNDDDE
jgi:hypothetical protein